MAVLIALAFLAGAVFAGVAGAAFKWIVANAFFFGLFLVIGSFTTVSRYRAAPDPLAIYCLCLGLIAMVWSAIATVILLFRAM